VARVTASFEAGGDEHLMAARAALVRSCRRLEHHHEYRERISGQGVLHDTERLDQLCRGVFRESGMLIEVSKGFLILVERNSHVAALEIAIILVSGDPQGKGLLTSNRCLSAW
jgi:hypothetical protein